jgi:putative hydrolase of the HAD superfamily
MADQLNIRFSEEQISDIIDYFGNLIFEISPENIPHVKSLINHLSRTYPLAIISDTGYISGKYIRAFLKKEELLSCFQSTVFSDEEENSKPHASLFHKTAKNLGISVNRMVHTGDLELTDVRGAKSAGCKSIKFIGVNASDGETSAADRIIDSYDQFNHILKDLFAEDNDPSE